MKQLIKCGMVALAIFFVSCSHKPSEKDIIKKILKEYACTETATINELKILKTEETESTPNIHVFKYTVSGEIEWLRDCTGTGTTITKGKKERFGKTVMLTQDKYGLWK